MLGHASRLIGHCTVQRVDDVHAIAQCRDALGRDRNEQPQTLVKQELEPEAAILERDDADAGELQRLLRNSSDSPGKARAACKSETIRVPSTPRWSARFIER